MTPTDLELFQRVAREFRRIADEIQKTQGVKDDRLLAIANSIDGDMTPDFREPPKDASPGRRR